VEIFLFALNTLMWYITADSQGLVLTLAPLPVASRSP